MRLIDRLRPRADSARLWGGQGEASGAAFFTTTYGRPGDEAILPTLATAASSAYGSNAIVFGAILARAMLFSEAEFKWQNRRTRKVFGDGGLALLETPWPGGTTGELLVRMIQDADLVGNAFIWQAAPDRLVRLRPDWVTIISELKYDALGRAYREPIGYLYKPPAGLPDIETGGEQLFTVDEVAHWSPIPDPWASFRGMSWLTPVFRDIEGDTAMTQYKIKYLENAASPNLLIKYSQRLGKGVAERVQERITARHGGVDNAFRTLVLDEGADVSVIGNTFEQMNFSTVQAAGENRIVIASGVPGIVIGSKEGLMAATYSNYAQAMRRFADLTMRPLWRSACACLEKLVTSPADSRLWYDTAGIAALRQGEKEQADTMLVKAQAAAALVAAQYDPASVTAALEAGDMTQLVHSPVTIQAPAAPKQLNGAQAKPPAQIGAGQ